MHVEGLLQDASVEANPDELLRRGHEARARGDHAEALTKFQAAAAANPNDRWAPFEAAVALRELRRLEQARAAFEMLVVDVPDFAAAFHQLGLTLRELGDIPAAHQHFSAAASLEPENPWHAFEAASALALLDRVDEAEAQFSQLADRHPEFFGAFLGRGQLARKRGDHVAALADFQRTVELNPEHFWAALDVGVELKALGKTNEAEAAFRELLGRNPTFMHVYRELGFLTRERGDHEAAFDAFQSAARLDASGGWNHLEIADSLSHLGRFDEARETLETLIETYPDFAQGRHRFGIFLRQSGDLVAALEQFAAAARLPGSDPWPTIEVASTLQDMGRLREARAQLEGLVAASPAFAPAHQHLGLLLRRLGDHGEALERFRIAADLNPDNLWFRHEIGVQLKSVGLRGDAAATFKRVVESDASFAQAWIELAQMAREDGDRVAALSHIDAALAAGPHNKWLQIERANALREDGRLLDARFAIEQVIAADPAFAPAYFALGELLRRLGDPVASRLAFAKVVEIDPQHMWAKLEIAMDSLYAGRPKEAVASLESVIVEHPGFARARLLLGQIRRDLDQWEAAIALFGEALELEPDNPWIARDLASAWLRIGKAQDASAVMEGVIARAPHSAEALIGWVEVTRRGRDPRQIAEMLERAVEMEPGNRHAAFVLAEEHLRQGRFDAATAVYNRVLAAESDNPHALAGLGQAARLEGRADEALERFLAAAAAAERTGWEGAALELSREYALAGRLEQAEAVLRPLVAKNPFSTAPRMQLVHNARLLGDFKTALAELDALVAIHTDLAFPRVELAYEELRAGRREAARARLRSVIAEHPRCAPAYDALAHLAQQSDDVEYATRFLQRSVSLDPTSMWPRVRLAQFEAMVGKGDAALATLTSLRDEFPASPELALARAAMLRELGHYPEAWRALQEAAQAFPHSFDVRCQRASVAIEFGRFDVADAAVADAGRRSAAERARLEMLSGQWAEARWDDAAALAHFEAALAFNPTDTGAAHGASMVALRQLDLEAAARHIATHARNDPMHLMMMRGKARPSQTHHGQLLTEFRLDSRVVEKIAAARTSADPLGSLSAIVRDFPDSTAAGIALLIALRRAGRFARPQPGAGRVIPRRLAQFWDSDLPGDVAALCASWQTQNPDIEYQRFDLASAREFLSGAFPPEVRRAFERAVEPARKADLFRLAYLHVHGGYWADADDRNLGPLTGIIGGDRALALYQEGYGTSGNNFIAAAPGHPVMASALGRAVEAMLRGDGDEIWLATGPGLLTRALAGWLAEDLTRVDEMDFLERHQLSQAIAVHCLASYKHSERHWSRSAAMQADRRKNDWREFLDPWQE